MLESLYNMVIFMNDVNSNSIYRAAFEGDAFDFKPLSDKERFKRIALYFILIITVVGALVLFLGWSLRCLVAKMINGKISFPDKTKVVKREILEGLWLSEDARFPKWDAIRENFTLISPNVQTPGGNPIYIKFLKHNKSGTTTPTMIYFPGVSQSADEQLVRFHWLFKESIDRELPCNFVFFDYRDLDELNNFFPVTNDDPALHLKVDGATVVQWVIKGLKTIPANVSIYGYSLGGAVSIEVIAELKYPVKNIINDRSFDSITENIKQILENSWYGRCLSWTLELQGYETNIAKAWELLPEDSQKLVFYADGDKVISKEASLYFAVEKNKNKKTTLLFIKRDDQNPEIRLVNVHHKKLKDFITGEKIYVSNEIANRILGKSNNKKFLKKTQSRSCFSSKEMQTL